MKATNKQLDYIKRLYKGVYSERQLNMLTTKTASKLISALLKWSNPMYLDNKYLGYAFEQLLRAEKEAFGEYVSDRTY